MLILGVLTYSISNTLFTVAGTVTALNRVPYKLAKKTIKCVAKGIIYSRRDSTVKSAVLQ